MKVSIEQLIRQAPSIATDHAHPGVSDKYVHINTLHVVDLLAENGWFPHRATQQLVRAKGREGFQRHWINFRREEDMEAKRGDELFEIVLGNSHDRTRAWRFNAGIFRMICSNGLVVSTSTFATMFLKHINIDAGQIKILCNRVSSTMSGVHGSIDDMKNLEVSPESRLKFAEFGLNAKYGSLDRSPIHPITLLNNRRPEDSRANLWTTFNVIQENLIKGDQMDAKLDAFNRPFGVSKAINQVDRQIALNQDLWEYAEAVLAEAKN